MIVLKARKLHIPLVVSILLALVVFTAGNFWYLQSTEARIAQTEQEMQDFIQESDAELQRIEEEKIAKEKARQEAAQKLAEGAKTGTIDPNTIDTTACNPLTTHNNPANSDVLVNKKHCIQPLKYTPGDLTSAHGATLSAKAMTAFIQLFNAAAAAGQPFYVSSSYRSYATQVSTYAHWVSVSGKDGADTYSARPGYSEHQTGFAFDVAANGCTLNCFGSTSQYKWFQAHAAEYGFIQRYYAGYEAITGYTAEEWHYRYVGVAVAQDMKAKNIKTLEEYWGISGGDY